MLPNDSDHAKLAIQLQTALGIKLEILFVSMCSTVSYFEIFYNVVGIMHDAPAAAKARIQIWGFLKLRKNEAKTGWDKLLTPTV